MFGFASLRDLPEIEAMQEAGLLDLPQDSTPVDPLDDLLAKGDEMGDDEEEDRAPVFDAPDRWPAD